MSVIRVCSFAAGVALLLASASSNAFAGQPTPEIDGGSLSMGLGVLAASVLIIRARLRK